MCSHRDMHILKAWQERAPNYTIKRILHTTLPVHTNHCQTPFSCATSPQERPLWSSDPGWLLPLCRGKHLSALCRCLIAHKLGIKNKNASFCQGMEQEQLPGKKFNSPGGKRYLQLLSVSTRGVGWILLRSGQPKHPKGIYCAGEQQNLLKEFRPENTQKKRAKKQEKKVMVSKYRVEGPGLRLLRVPAPPSTKDVFQGGTQG